jgi:hypothetical protein
MLPLLAALGQMGLNLGQKKLEKALGLARYEPLGGGGGGGGQQGEGFFSQAIKTFREERERNRLKKLRDIASSNTNPGYPRGGPEP